VLFDDLQELCDLVWDRFPFAALKIDNIRHARVLENVKAAPHSLQLKSKRLPRQPNRQSEYSSIRPTASLAAYAYS
jgi:hypothetical protein